MDVIKEAKNKVEQDGRDRKVKAIAHIIELQNTLIDRFNTELTELSEAVQTIADEDFANTYAAYESIKLPGRHMNQHGLGTVAFH